MDKPTMQHIVLSQRPEGPASENHFRLETKPMPVPAQDDVLVELAYLSVDPYMRGRMDDVRSYAKPVALGSTMEGGAVGRVIASRSAAFETGDYVMGPFGWASHGCCPAPHLRKLDKKIAPISTALGVLGMPGFTGWYGFEKLGRPKRGETLVVAAATGPVGSMVGQLAKAAGLRAIGIAGGAKKCTLAIEHFGFEQCVDHTAFATSKDLRAALKSACPDGVDIYFENVAGKVLEAVMPLMNTGGRIPICGLISWYDEGALGGHAAGGAQDSLPKLWRSILVKRLSINGFIISDHWALFDAFLADIAPRVAAGEIRFYEDITEGLENAPKALTGLLNGQNFGKQLIKL